MSSFRVEIPPSGITLSNTTNNDFENVRTELEDDEEMDDDVNIGDFVDEGLEEEEEEEDLNSRPSFSPRVLLLLHKAMGSWFSSVLVV